MIFSGGVNVGGDTTNGLRLLIIRLGDIFCKSKTNKFATLVILYQHREGGKVSS